MKKAVRVGGIYYRVYKHHGEIMVSRGVINPNGNFEPFNGSSPYMTCNPDFVMSLEHGKVLCEEENDIPKAIELVKGEDKPKAEIKNKKNEEAYDSLPEKVRKILNDLFCGNITISEYEAKIDELTREHAISYEFSTTETEFNVIKHAVNRLKAMLDIRLDPTHRYYGKQPLTTEERWTMETERAAARELIFRLDAVKGE